jgi:hypothetical protein
MGAHGICVTHSLSLTHTQICSVSAIDMLPGKRRREPGDLLVVATFRRVWFV